MRILVAEDEPKLSAFLKEGLEENNFSVDTALDGASASWLTGKNHYDLILLDIVMPYLDGLELCRQIKQSSPDTSILLLTALGTNKDKLKGFEAGADDYMVKPFEFKELLARVRALTRRNVSGKEPANLLRVADLELDLDERIAHRAGQKIALTAKEFSLLEFFMRNKKRVLTRGVIAEKVWDIHFDSGTNVVDVYVNLLRKKIDKNFDRKLIQTRIGMGYIMNDE